MVLFYYKRLISPKLGKKKLRRSLTFVENGRKIYLTSEKSNKSANFRTPEEIEPTRTIWLAITDDVWHDFFQRPFIKKVIKRQQIEIMVFDSENETVLQWIK